MKLAFKTLRPGLFLEGVLARLDESTRDIILDELCEADERLAALEAPHWVHVEDQLPPAMPGTDYSDWVLCANNPDLEPVPQMVAGFNHRTQEWVDYDGTALPVYHMTHWQPLPAAPAQTVKGDLQGE